MNGPITDTWRHPSWDMLTTDQLKTSVREEERLWPTNAAREQMFGGVIDRARTEIAGRLGLTRCVCAPELCPTCVDEWGHAPREEG